MKTEITTCDICGAEMKNNTWRYMFTIFKRGFFLKPHDTCDVCSDCNDKVREFVNDLKASFDSKD